MSDSPARCVTADAAWSGAAALATVSAHHGIAIGVRELAEISHTEDTREIDEGMVLVLARTLGFEATAMEGGYGDLPDVVLPLLVALREGERDRYAVLFAFDEVQATVGDPVTGAVTSWTRERFCAQWTGSVVQVTPKEDERVALSTRLARLRDPRERALRFVGWTPPFGPKVAMLAACVAVVGVAIVAPHPSALDVQWVAFVAAACVGSLWSWLGAGSCAQCSQARALAGGLPLGAMGTALYALLLASAFAPVPSLAIAIALGVAEGAHVALVLTLARAKLTCGPCLFVAACALGAAVTWIVGYDAPLVSVAVFAIAGVATAAALFAIFPVARARESRLWRANAESLANAVLAEPRSVPAGHVVLVAYKRVGCASCAFFEAAVKPALQATYEDALTIEERDLGSTQTMAPLLLLLGTRRTLFIGLPLENAVPGVIQAVNEALEGEPADDAPLIVRSSV